MLISAAPGSAQKGMEYSITPYLWASALDGSIGLGDISAEVDVPFSDLLDAVDVVIPIHFEAKGGKWALAFDVSYSALSQDLEVPDPINGETDIDLLFLELWAAWDVSPTFAILFGSRYVDMDIDLEIVPPGPLPALKTGAGQNWVDPIVGFRYHGSIGRRWQYWLRGDLGGFGLGSDLSWQVRLGFLRQLSQVTSLSLGYHWLDIDYDQNNFAYDMLMSGPEIGFRFKF